MYRVKMISTMSSINQYWFHLSISIAIHIVISQSILWYLVAYRDIGLFDYFLILFMSQKRKVSILHGALYCFMIVFYLCILKNSLSKDLARDIFFLIYDSVSVKKLNFLKHSKSYNWFWKKSWHGYLAMTNPRRRPRTPPELVDRV